MNFVEEDRDHVHSAHASGCKPGTCRPRPANRETRPNGGAAPSCQITPPTTQRRSPRPTAAARGAAPRQHGDEADGLGDQRAQDGDDGFPD
ncbi:MAG: hypothetical protein ACREQD_06965, partial [Candidatus Binataceae bacterium]